MKQEASKQFILHQNQQMNLGKLQPQSPHGAITQEKMDIIWHMVCCPRMQKSQAKENTTATTLKQRISKFYPIIISTEVSFYIYDRPLTGINVVAYAFLKWWLLQKKTN